MSLGLKKLVDSEILQRIINLFNHIIGFATQWQIPSASGLGNSIHEWVLEHKSIEHVSLILWSLGIIVILYLGTIILRHHYREQAPFLNDIEAKWLKLKMRFALGASKDSMYDEDEKRIRKVDLAARRRIRWMRVYIHTRKQQGEAVPTK
ncbi:hypothetical protein DLS40_13420, partial [Staphylococcus pseudintermedius]